MFGTLIALIALRQDGGPQWDRGLAGDPQEARQERDREAPDAQVQTKAQEDVKFHKPDVVGMSATERMAGFQHRLQMEADSPFQRVLWKSIGPEVQGGRVVDIDSPLSKPKQTLVAFATGGLWRTEDDGVTWTPIFDNQSAFSIGDIAVNKSGDTIWVGTGENNSQRTSYSGTGVFKSTDAGKTWTNMGLPESHHIGRILIDPKHEDTVWVASLGHLYSENPERGVYKTTDGGKTWQWILKVDSTTGAVDLVMDPRNPNIVFASTWDRDRRAWDFREGGKGTAVYKTTDGGKNWTKITALPCDSDTGRIGLAIAPSKPDIVYAFLDNQNPDQDSDRFDERSPNGTLTILKYRRAPIEALLQIDDFRLRSFLSLYLPDDVKSEDVVKQLKDGKLDKKGLDDLFLKKNPHIFDQRIREAEVWRSDDSGKTWTNVSGRMGSHGGYYGGDITVDPTNPDIVYTGGVLLLRSKDGAKSWSMVARESHVDFHVVYIDPRDHDRQWEGCDGGLYFSGDGGEHWRHFENMAVGQFTTIAVDDKTPYNVYGGLQDNGTMKGPNSYVPGRSDPNDWKSIGGGDGSAVAVDPRDGGDIVYVASQFGDHEGYNQKTNERWTARAPGRGLRYNWISPIFVSSFDPDIVYLGSNKLHRSFNMGKKYEDISPDLTKNKPNGNVPFSTLTTVSESPLRFGLIYTGADDGSVKMTPDSGYQWVDIATPRPDNWVTRIVASQYDVGTVYCSQNGYRQDDFSPYVWKSTDFGKTWQSVVGDLPAEPVNTVREDPVRKDVLWVGTDMGVYITFDGGHHWDVYGGGLPHTPVHDLAVQARAKEMVVATHARSVWKISTQPVYDLTDDIRKSEFYFWPVSGLTGSDRWGYQRRGEWDKTDPSEPTATVEFWTSLRGKGKVVLKDKDGKEVKSADYDVAPGFNWVSIGMQLAAGNPNAPGDFTTPKTGDDVTKDPYLDRRPKYVPKGDYTIEIQVAGKVGTAKMKVS